MINCNLEIKFFFNQSTNNEYIVPKMDTLSQKWIRCPKNGYTVPKMETLSQKWIHCPKNGYIVPKMDTLSQKWIHCPKNGHTVPKMDTLSQKWVRCPKSNLNLRIRTKPVTDGADAAVLICFLGQNYSKAGHIPLHLLQS